MYNYLHNPSEWVHHNGDDAGSIQPEKGFVSKLFSLGKTHKEEP